MVISATGRLIQSRVKTIYLQSPSSGRGFTLIELMVVVFIIALIAGFASLSIGNNSNRAIEQEAKRFAALVRLANEESILNAIEMGIKIYKTSYKFGQLGAKNTLTGLADDDGIFRPRSLPDGVFLKLEMNGEVPALGEATVSDSSLRTNFESNDDDDDDITEDEDDGAPMVYILSSGEMTDFSLQFATEQSSGYQVIGDIVGDIKLRRTPE